MKKLEKIHLEHSNNIPKISSNLDNYIKLSEELKQRLERQYLLNEVRDTHDKESAVGGFTSMNIDFIGIDNNFMGETKIKLFSDKKLAKDILNVINNENINRIQELYKLLNETVL